MFCFRNKKGQFAPQPVPVNVPRKTFIHHQPIVDPKPSITSDNVSKTKPQIIVETKSLPIVEPQRQDEDRKATENQQNSQDNQRPSEQTPKISKATSASDSLTNEDTKIDETPSENGVGTGPQERRGGIIPITVKYDENAAKQITKHPKDPADVELLKDAFRRNEFLKQLLKDDLLQDIVDAMYNREIKAKEVIIREGEQGSHLYVSASGKYEISLKTNGVVDVFEDVRVFGELAILYNDKRKATIRALKAGRCWVLDRSVYQQLVIGGIIKKQDEILNFLETVPKLNVIGRVALQKVATLLKSELFTPGQEIVRQGDYADKFYIIRIGTVTITRENEGVVNKFKPGQYFGELGLLNKRRQATVIANPPGVECLTLKRQDFFDHFGDVEDISTITVQQPKTIENVDNEYSDIQLDDLRIMKTLGVGGFGRVELVQHMKKPELTFALKYLKKYDMVEQNQQEHVYNEKTLQMSCQSIFIVHLYKTFKSRKYIYFLMEVCLGGDLWTLLQRQKHRRFEEIDARFIAACVLEAFAYLHERNIVYRDLKPENLLIDKDGYIKLTDFGFAKELGPRGRTFTFAGTPEYVSPEIVLNRGHDKAVDYWAFGIFIFELLTGKTPFRTNDVTHIKTYNKILSGIDNADFPPHVSYKARNIIEKLCKPLAVERLGCQRGGINDVKNAKWFMGFDWIRLNKKEIQSPFKPKLKSSIDTTNFDQFKEDKDVPPDESSGWDEDF